MSDDPAAGDCTSCGNAAGANRQQGTRGLSVQGRTGDVHYYAACDHHSAAGVGRRTASDSPAPYEALREGLYRITRACSLLVDGLRDDTDYSEGAPWD